VRGKKDSGRVPKRHAARDAQGVTSSVIGDCRDVAKEEAGVAPAWPDDLQTRGRRHPASLFEDVYNVQSEVGAVLIELFSRPEQVIRDLLNDSRAAGDEPVLAVEELLHCRPVG
jgi:hypothetical protein